MGPGILTRMSFESYSSDAQNNFKKSEEEKRKCAYVNKQINDFYFTSKSKQGIIGKSWDKVKCFLNFKTSSKNIENTLKEYNSDIYNSSKEADAIVAMNQYTQSQESALNVVRNFISNSVSGVLFSSLYKNLKKPSNNKYIAALIVLSGVVGGVVGVVAKKLDAKSANREYDKKETERDFIMGILQGGISAGLSFGIFALIGDKLKLIPRMIIKSSAKFLFNIASSFSLALAELKASVGIIKFLNPDRYQTMVDKIAEQENMDKYQFYNPRYKLNNDARAINKNE